MWIMKICSYISLSIEKIYFPILCIQMNMKGNLKNHGFILQPTFLWHSPDKLHLNIDFRFLSFVQNFHWRNQYKLVFKKGIDATANTRNGKINCFTHLSIHSAWGHITQERVHWAPHLLFKFSFMILTVADLIHLVTFIHNNKFAICSVSYQWPMSNQRKSFHNSLLLALICNNEVNDLINMWVISV